MILVVGDIHCKFERLNYLVQTYHPEIILQCGDLGYWTGLKPEERIQPEDTRIHWIEGNHEDHVALHKLIQSGSDIRPGVIYQPRGSTLTLPDGRTVRRCETLRRADT